MTEARVFRDSILSKGISGIQEMVEEKQEETLHLEFKTVSSASTSNLAKEDRKVFAKAICGLANAEGGTIVVGIRTTKVDGLDVASGRQPVENCARLRSQTAAALPEMISPQHPEITVDPIVDDDDSSSGYLVIDVPPSDRRPHMSLKEHRYFRRGSDGTRMMEHGEIRDLMLAARAGILDVECNVRNSSATGDLRFSLSLVLTLKNVGKVPVIAPYIRIKGSGWNAAGMDAVSGRTLGDGSFGIYGSRDVIVHLDDEISLAYIDTGLDFRGTGLVHLPDAVSAVRKSPQTHIFSMLPWSVMVSQVYQSKDQPIRVSGLFGAENVAVTPFSFDITKRVLFDKFCALQGL